MADLRFLWAKTKTKNLFTITISLSHIENNKTKTKNKCAINKTINVENNLKLLLSNMQK